MKEKNKKGITLIALVVTIIILLILVGVIFRTITGENGMFSRAEKSAFVAKMGAYKEQVDLYASWQITETLNTNIQWINSGEPLKIAIEQEVVSDIKPEDVNIAIEEIIDSITEEEKEYLVVYKGELYYVWNKEIPDNERKAKWCQQVGIKILKIVAPEGIEVRNGKYEFVNGVYLCTPNVASGFVKEKTRYLEVDSNGNLVPGNWITDKPTENWYDYKNQKWANIHVENNGSEIYYVWIPRYCFKLNHDMQRSDVKFIDLNNNFKDENDKQTLWAELEEQGYQVPEAFSFNGEELPGYWVMKYTAGDITVPSTVNYDMSVIQGVVTIRNITVNSNIVEENQITKYTIALNGKIIETISDSAKLDKIKDEIIQFSNLRVGNNTINVTALNADGGIVGSMTKEYAPAQINKPDLSGFNPQTTFYVTYDENGNEHSTIPITEKIPQYWYEYGESRWANIVTRNNGLETYYTWIPRYEFALDQTNQRSIVKFVSGSTTETTPGYQIPEAFTFNGQELTGFWSMKYTAGSEAAPRFETEMVATNSSIRTKGITGTALEDGQIYQYYINGQYKGQTTNSAETFEYTGLEAQKTYTILVEIRKQSTDEYLGSIVKQITTISANKPELTGFNPDCTYYVLYDEQGKESIGDKIKNDGSNMPNNWYDYTGSKWANILVEVNGKKTYYTWIPRYEFRITSSQYMQPAEARTEVRFLKGNSTDVATGYQIPEAFTFNGQEISGFWAMKYTAGE